jgi:hypothetical protein
LYACAGSITCLNIFIHFHYRYTRFTGVTVARILFKSILLYSPPLHN